MLMHFHSSSLIFLINILICPTIVCVCSVLLFGADHLLNKLNLIEAHQIGRYQILFSTNICFLSGLVYRSIGPTRCCCRLDFCVDHLSAQIGGGDMVEQCALPKWNHFILRYSALWPKGIGHEKDTVYVESPAALHS